MLRGTGGVKLPVHGRYRDREGNRLRMNSQDPDGRSPSVWPGWKAKFLSSHAAQLAPDRALQILEQFLEGERYALEKGKEQGDTVR